MRQRQLLINAVMSLAQVVVIGITLFVLYRFLLRTMGVEKLGVWSVVLASSTVANIANLGISASVVKFVAQYLARAQEENVLALIQTSTISIGVFVGCGLLLAYPLAGWLLGLVIPSSHLKEALSVLPYALVSLWVTIIASVFQAGLDGFQRIDHRSALLSGGAVVFLVLCFVMVPTYGLIGLGYAQVINAVILLVASWFMLKRHLRGLPVFPKRWDRSLFREMLGYSINFQFISILTLLYDPVTKTLLAKFGGLSMTGYYDMASKMLLQIRSLVVSANQVIVPFVADLQEKKPEYIRAVYADSSRLVAFVALPLYFAIMALSPVVSELWIGHYESTFVVFCIVLSIGWLVNSLIAPAYFVYLGKGDLSWNVIGHVAIGVLNAVVGFLLGSAYGGIAVAAAWVFSLIVGSCIIFISYHYKNQVALASLFSKENTALLAGSFLGVAGSLALYDFVHARWPHLALLAGIPLLYSAAVAVPLWRHPMRARVANWVHHYLLALPQH